MSIAWPLSLQQFINQENFSESKGSTSIRSQSDVGPDKVRRRSTRAINQVSGSIFLTVGEYSIFNTFFDTTINGGVEVFQTLHPITGILTNFRFKGEPSFRNIGGVTFVVSFVWEALA